MFKTFVRTAGLTCLASVIGLATEAQGAATMSLKAVKKNNVDIPGGPTNSTTVVPNDTITCEIYLSGWGTPPFDGSTGLVRTYQGTVLGAAGAISNGVDPDVPANISRMVLPVGWVAPYFRESCSNGCQTPGYPNCHNLYGCVGAGHAPDNGASINNTRTDFIFFGFSTVLSTEVSLLDYKWAGTINGSDGQTASRCQNGTFVGSSCSTNADCGAGNTCNPNYQSYLGTYNLKVGSLACGVYTFNFSSDVTYTFISNTDAFPTPVVPILQGLTLTVTGQPACPVSAGACCIESTGVCTNNVTQPNCAGRWGGAGSTCATLNPPCVAPTGACCIESSGVCTNSVTQANCAGRWGGATSTCANISPPCVGNQIVGVNPPHCTIDARIPNLQSQLAQRRGFTQMILTFQNAPGTGEDAANDFEVTQIPPAAPPNPPTITSVVAGPGANDKTLNFSAPIQPNKHTCVRHIASNKRRCITFLPGDAGGNLTVGPTDILSIIDNLNGITNPPLPITQCDIDRQGTCVPLDIVIEIDMLNGAGYPNQNGDTIVEPCPSINVP